MISLFVENGVAYVWNAEDWFTLRSEHRICGALVGSLPSFPRQNDFMGLPMALMYEEAVLLVKRGICELYELPNISIKPNEEEKQEVKAMEERILTEQTEALKKRRIEQISQKIDIIVAGKRQKLLSKGVSVEVSKNPILEQLYDPQEIYLPKFETVSPIDSNLNKETLLQEEIDKLPALLPAHVLLHLPTQHHIDTEKTKVSVDALNSAASRDDPSHFLIFNYLWEQGHHITSGSKFGCDYLLYPGDPVKFHAMYMVRCVKDASTYFRPINLISFGRLAVAVNKIAILAFCNGHGQVQCQTLQWHDNVS